MKVKRFILTVGIFVFLFLSIKSMLNVTRKVEAQTNETSTLFQTEVINTDNLMDFSEAVSKLSTDEPEILPEEIPKVDEYVTKRLIVKTKENNLFYKEYPADTIIKGPDNISVLQFSTIAQAKDSLEQLKKDSKVEYAEPDILYGIGTNNITQAENKSKALKSVSGSTKKKITYQSWGVKKIEADKYASYLSKKKKSGLIVAVVDTGVSSHKFLSGRITKNGYDFVDSDKDASDKNGHGTHVAGTIVDCTQGLNIKIMPVRVLNKNGVGSVSNIANGIKYAADNGAKVINISLGGGHSRSIDNAVNYAVKKGVIVVVAAGNEYEDVYYSCPAHNTKAITVAALDYKERKADFSNYGSTIDVAAPGVDISSCVPEGGYREASGTSMATPHISAVAAMIKMNYPSKSPAEVEIDIKKMTKDLGQTGWDRYFGFGLPKLSKAIEAKSIKLNEKAVSIVKNSKIKLIAKVTPGGFVTYKSSNNKIAVVNENGLVTGKKVGRAVVTATTINGLSATCSVNVVSDKSELIQPTKIILDQSKITLDTGKSAVLTATIKPDNTVKKEVTFTSSNHQVAEVTEFGIITAYQSGSTTITATTTNGITAKCEVTVLGLGVQPTKVSLNQKKVKVLIGDTIPIWANVTPSNATDKRLYWSADNNNVKIEKNGQITAVKAGVTTIKAAATNALYDECVVTIIDPDLVVEPKKIILSHESIKLEVGANVYLTATVKPDDVTDPTVTFSSNNTLIADVTPQGIVIGKMKGTTTITVRASNGLKEYCTVTVVNPVILPTMITLDKSEFTMEKGQYGKLAATLSPSNATEKEITWSTSDNSIVDVNYFGNITAYKEGTAVITATAENGLTASCTITVKKVPVLPYLVSLENRKQEIEVDETYTFKAKIYPSYADDKTLSWSSSDKSIALVNESGMVTGIKPGTVTITVKTSNGKADSIKMTVTDNIKQATSIWFEQNKIQLSEGESKILTISATPKNAALKNISWISKDSSIATVDLNGKVTGIKAGSTSILAKLPNGLSAQCEIIVSAKEILVSELSINPKQISIEAGKTEALSVTIVPNNATQTQISWSSSMPEVAGVSNSGTVTGYKVGTAVITVKSRNGLTANCTVTVTAPPEAIPESIVLDVLELTMKIGETKKLTATVTPQNSENNQISWRSSDEKIISVNSNGEIICNGVGTAVITAALANGASASCTVTIKPDTILPAAISLDKHTIQLTIGGTEKLIPTIIPNEVTDQTLTWSSSNSDIAFVDSVGTITALAEGSTTITVRTSNNLEDICMVNVVKLVNELPIINETFHKNLWKLYESIIFRAMIQN